MRSWISVGELCDTILDNVAIRSGVLLTLYDLLYLLKGSDLEEWIPIFEQPLESGVGVRPEFLEEMVLLLRTRIGNIADPTWGYDIARGILLPLRARRIDIDEVLNHLQSSLNPWQHLDSPRSVVDEVVRKYCLKEQDASIILEAIMAIEDRMLRLDFEECDWSDVKPLSQLFSTEAVPSDADLYLDQRFIDFLAVRGETIDQIHWRNFERLCAEYFNRKSYIVSLGPGRNDGGVDLRIWSSDTEPQGPPLLIVQCKRLNRKRDVKVEFVKAFWTDIIAERARAGVIITTGGLAPSGERVARARRWPLSFAEREKVMKWVYCMWRHRWSRRHKRTKLGRFLLPPVVTMNTPVEAWAAQFRLFGS